MPLGGDAQRAQPRLPAGRVRAAPRAVAQIGHHGRRQLLPLPVGQGRVVDHVVGVRPAEDLQEVLPALAVGAGEVGEQLVADVRARAVAAPVAGAGVIDLDVRRPGPPRRQQPLLLPVEGRRDFRQQAAELAGGQVEAPLAQLLQQERLGDVVVVVLVQDEGVQVGAVVAAGEHVGRQRGQQGAAVGGHKPLPAVAGDVGAEDQLLDDVVLVALGGRARRGVGHRQGHLLVDDQQGVLGALGGAGALVPGAGGRRRRGLFEAAGGQGRAGAEALEAGDLVAQLLQELLLVPDDLQQALDQGGAFLRGNLGEAEVHTINRGKRRQPAALPRGY